MKKLVAIAILLLAPIAYAQTTQTQCTQATTAPSVQLPGAPTCTGTTCSYTDTSPVDGSTYMYVAVATDTAGNACSNILLNVAIPATGAHTVALTFTASTTPNVTYAIFRETPPANPSGLSATVN